MAGKPIGELNGRWAFLLKVTLVLIPSVFTLVGLIAVPWVQWVTETTYAVEAHFIEAEKCAEDVQKQIDDVESRLRQNNSDHTDIKLSLEQIKGKLGIEGNK